MISKLPFEYTTIVIRYIRDLTILSEDFLGEDLGTVFKIRSYAKEENPSPKSELNRISFFEYLENIKTIKLSYKGVPGIAIDYPHQEDFLLFPAYQLVEIVDVNPIKDLLGQYEELEAAKKMSGKIKWSKETRLLEYKNKKHKFQKGTRQQDQTLTIISILHQNRKEKSRKNYAPVELKRLAYISGIVNDRRNETYDVAAEESIKQIIKGIQDKLRADGILVKIKVAHGEAQMIAL